MNISRLDAIQMIVAEVERARSIFPTWPTSLTHQAAIIMEEAGELIQAALQHKYEPHKGGNMVKEAVQTGAMAVRFIDEMRGKAVQQIVADLMSCRVSVTRACFNSDIVCMAKPVVVESAKLLDLCDKAPRSVLPQAAFNIAREAVFFIEHTRS